MRLSLTPKLAGLLMALPLATLGLRPLPAIAQDATQNNPTSDNWTDFPMVATQFQQGCMGTEALTPAQAQIKQNFCQCAWQEYQIRYSPAEFAEINALATALGPDALVLVNLMIDPELDDCARISSYVRPQ